jgi:hypothetical protein
MLVIRVLIVAIATWASISAGAAQPMERRIVEIIKKVCVQPESPAAIMAAAEVMAADHGWKLDETKSGRRPFGLIEPPDPNGPPFFVVTTWALSEPGATGSHLIVSVVGPENPGITINGCSILVPGPKFIDLATEVQRRLGKDVIKSKAKPISDIRHTWYFKQNGKGPEKCNKFLMIEDALAVDGNFTQIALVQIEAEKGSKWEAFVAEATGKCEKP